MKDPTTVLYALSTLAQTCAALAAFVGAVGLYRIQSLASRREALHVDLHRTTGGGPVTYEQVLSWARTQTGNSLVSRLGVSQKLS